MPNHNHLFDAAIIRTADEWKEITQDHPENCECPTIIQTFIQHIMKMRDSTDSITTTLYVAAIADDNKNTLIGALAALFTNHMEATIIDALVEQVKEDFGI